MTSSIVLGNSTFNHLPTIEVSHIDPPEIELNMTRPEMDQKFTRWGVLELEGNGRKVILRSHFDTRFASEILLEQTEESHGLVCFIGTFSPT